jgi:hypothetical protein
MNITSNTNINTNIISRTPFWSTEPTVLFNKDSISQIWINPNMIFEEKLNAISRLVILLSVVGFVFTKELRFLLVGFVTLTIIYCIYKYREQNNVKKEGFELTQTKITDPVTLTNFVKSDFYKTNKKNPLSNVLLTDISDTPDRKSAPPSFNNIVDVDINAAAKKAIQTMNPGIKNTNKQLFGDLAQQFEFDQHMRNFYTTPNTKVTNDQTAFAEYLYGNMPSCKEGDGFACVQDNLRYIQM